MADDLREYLSSEALLARPTPDRSSRRCSTRVLRPNQAEGVAPRKSDPSRQRAVLKPMKIVPKGLCSFDEHDADFFLELLPGPRDRYGLPDSLPILENKDPGDRSRQDVSRGPLVRAVRVRQVVADQGGASAAAGASTSWPVYIEATPEETEARLLQGCAEGVPRPGRRSWGWSSR